MSDTFGNIINGAAGTAQGKQGTTVQTLSISLAAGFVLFGVQFSAFLIIRNYLWAKRIYQPRSFLIPVKDRVKPPPSNPLKWIITLLKIPSDVVLRKDGMDAYFFLRYLLLCLKIFGPMALVFIPILIPLNFHDGKGTRTIDGTRFNVTGLDTVAWSNVAPEHTDRYWAHCILAVVMIVWVFYLFYKELIHYVVKRQEFLSSPSHRLKASSTTVLITSIPTALCTVEALMELYDDFPGGVRRIWLNRNYDALVKKDKLRKQLEDHLEQGETNLIRKVVKQHRKNNLKGQASKDTAILHGSTHPTTTASAPLDNDIGSRLTLREGCDQDLQHDIATEALWTKYISPRRRSTMRIPKPEHVALSKIPLVGRFFTQKMDTIFYCRRELARLNHEIDAEILDADSCPQNNSAFIQFNIQKGAHMACQAVADVRPGRMAQRLVEMSPGDINWESLNYSSRNKAWRLVIFMLLFILLIFVFGIISLFTGILSKISTLEGSTSWLRWVSTLPSWLISFIQGTLPPVILVILLSGPTPIVLRAMTNSTRGATTGSQGERSLQLWYFIFLLFELFVIPTISSGLTSIVQSLIHNTASVPEILATNLPTAANYYFSFLVVQALSISASSILQTIRLLNFYVFTSAKTPDAVFNKLSFTWRTRIGSNIPWYTTFAVIGLVYSVIAPIMLIFMLFTFGLFYIVIKNNVLYVIRTGDVDSGGVWLPSAINQTFTGVYCMEVCLIGLFFLVRDSQGNVTCEAQGIIIAILFVITIAYQFWLDAHFNGLYKYAPLRLEGEAKIQDQEYEATRLNPDRPSTSATAKDEKTEQPRQVNDLSQTSTTTSKTHSTPDQATLPRRPSMPTTQHSSRHSLTTADMSTQQAHDKALATQILARLNRPLDESRLAALESRLETSAIRTGNTLLPRHRDIEKQLSEDPINKIIQQHNDELEDLTAEERDLLISVAFTHPVLRETRPSVWIPQDGGVGVSDDEVRRTRERFGEGVRIENRGAFLQEGRGLRVGVDRAPPDMSEFAFVMGEL